MSIEADAGSVILGGLMGAHLRDDERADLAEGRIAGVVLYQHTVTAPTRNLDGTLTQLAALCAEIKSVAPAAIIALDHEGGRVQRVRHPDVDLPAARAHGAVGRGLPSTTRAAHATAGKALKEAGVTLILGPVADVCDGDDSDPIGDRSFGATPQTVEAHVKGAVKGYREAGVACCIKHWPGIGGVGCNHHFGKCAMPLRSDHATVFGKIGASFIMVGHTILTDLDTDLPATMSPSAYAQARRQLGTACVLCTDDMNMSAIASHHSVVDASVQAVAAGADLVLVGASPLQHQGVYDALLARATTDPIFAQRLSDARARITAALKQETKP